MKLLKNLMPIKNEEKESSSVFSKSFADMNRRDILKLTSSFAVFCAFSRHDYAKAEENPSFFSLEASIIKQPLGGLANSGEGAEKAALEENVYFRLLPRKKSAENIYQKTSCIGENKIKKDEPECKYDQIPIFHVKMGVEFKVEIENKLEQPCAFHLQGHHGKIEENDILKWISSPIQPKEVHTFSFLPHHPGIYPLIPILPQFAAEQNARGLHAIFIVEEPSPPKFDDDIVLILADKKLDDKGLIRENFLSLEDSTRMGRLGNKIYLNNKSIPTNTIFRPNAKIRARLVNLSNARIFPLTLNGMSAEVLAIDSVSCEPFDPLHKRIVLSPCSRVEMVLTMPAEAGRSAFLQVKQGGAKKDQVEGISILSILTQGEPIPQFAENYALPAVIMPISIPLERAVRADFIITGGDDKRVENDKIEDNANISALNAKFPDKRKIYAINGAFNTDFPQKPIASVKKGGALVLTLNNSTLFPKVISIHGHSFRLLHPFDDGWEPYFLDTCYLAPSKIARIALIAERVGRWAIRSTISEHYATGVLGWVEVL